MICKRFGFLLFLVSLVGSGYAQTTLSNGANISNGLNIIQSGALCSIPPQVLPSGTVGLAYDVTIVTANCPMPQLWSVTVGALPLWATLNPATGEITGTPDFAGTTNFTAQVLDGQGNSAIFPAGLSITASANGVPALPELALLNWNTARASTPASGPFVCVTTSGLDSGLANSAALAGGCSATFTTANFQAALNSLVCGNILVIQNVAALPAFSIPDTVCTDANWIIVEHDITDGTYPNEGQRISPLYMGIAQSNMPYYPYPLVDASAASTGRHMPQILASALNSVAPITIKVPTSGAGIHAPSHWRFIGLELTRDQTRDIQTVAGIDLSYTPGQRTGAPAGQDCDVTNKNAQGDPTVSSLPINALACMNVQPDHLIFDQMVIHGDAQRQTSRGINFAGSHFVAILDSYGYDIGLTAAGGGGDAQFYFGGGGHGFTGSGDWMMKNTFSSASTMASLFCGAFVEPISPVTGFDGVPHDVWWWQDFMWKNPLWNTQNGQSKQVFTIIEGRTYPQANDQELTVTPSAVTLNTSQVYAFNLYWGNDSFGGFNTMGAAAQGPGGGTISVDGIVNGNATVGTITRVAEHNVGVVPWLSANIRTYNYTAPVTPGTHTITFAASTVDSHLALLGNSRTLTAVATVTVVASGAPNSISLSPSAPDLQMQPSYSDANGNLRQFAYTMFAGPTFSSVTLTWKVDGIVNGNAAVGQICSATVVACSPPGANDSEVIYVSGTATGTHSLTVTSAGGTVSNPSAINVHPSAPILGYDFKPFTSKNGWECKCGTRILLEKSLIENGWGGQGNGGGQDGHAVLIQTINQTNQVLDGSGVNVGYGPTLNNDFTIRDNTFRNFGGGFVVVPLNAAKGTHRVAITNNLCDNCSVKNLSNGFAKLIAGIQVGGTAATKYGPNGVGGVGPLPWTSATNPLASDITFSHDSFFGDFTDIFSITNNTTPQPAIGFIGQWPIRNYIFRDSFFASAGTATFVNLNGEAGDCNTGNTELKAMANCLFPYSFDHVNLTDSTAPVANFVITPTKPIWQVSLNLSLFANPFGVNGPTDYRLCKGLNNPTHACTQASPFAAGQPNQASDGLDLGADAATLEALELNVKNGLSSPMQITTASVPDATVGTAYSFGLGVSGGVGPYSWTVPAGVIPPGAVDTLDYAAMPLPDRNSFHLSGTIVKYFHVDAGLLWWIKGASGNPWDGEAIGSDYIKQWFTEGTSFTNASGFKMYQTPVSLWKRYHANGADDVVYTPGPNRYSTTSNCGADGSPLIDNLGVRGELTGPFTDITWKTTYGGNIPDGTPYLLAQKWIKCTANNILNCTNEEDYWLVKGYGQVRWCPKTLSGGVYVTGTCTQETTKVAGGAPTPNFACKVPTSPVSGGLPAGSLQSSSTSMNLINATGQITGTPTTPGVSTFTVQVEDSQGHVAQQTLSLTVH